MPTLATVLTDDFADWETALLNAVARSYYGVGTLYVTPGGKPVTSSGGMGVQPDAALETLDVEAIDALVVCGGSIWQTERAPDLGPLLHAALRHGRIVGLICDATVAAAKAGILDNVHHTSNSPGYLDDTGYAGATQFRFDGGAVRDGLVVTAPGTASVRFMAEILGALGFAGPDLSFYEGLHAAQFAKAA